MKKILNEIRPAMLVSLCLLLLVSLVYPLIVWGASQILFSKKANGSLVLIQGHAVGSEWIGQDFHSARYFHSRPSAAGSGYDGVSSGGSNLGPTSQKLMDSINVRAMRYRNENGLDSGTVVPADAVMASASGLDPDISMENALLQVHRVASARGIAEAKVRALVERTLQKRFLGLLGEPSVNVLKLNLMLESI